VVLLLVAALAYSLFGTFVKLAYDNGASVSEVFAWRFALALPAIWLVTSLAGEARRHDVPRLPMLGAGLLFCAVALTAVAALETVPASVYIVVIYTYPAMVTLVGVARGDRPDARTWSALALATLGVALTVPDLFSDLGAVDGRGLVLTVLNAALYAAYILVSGAVLKGRTSQLSASAWSITGSAIGSAVFFGSGKVGLLPSAGAWAALAGLAIVSTVVASATFLAGLRRLGPTTSAITSTIEPVLGILWAVTILSERLRPVQVLGATLVLGSVLLLQMPSAAVTFRRGRKRSGRRSP
jgi:drug/metabolite transporter (DMT)-like permease